LKKNVDVSQSVTIVSLKNGSYHGFWKGLDVWIPCVETAHKNYEFQAYDLREGSGVPVLVVVDDYTARINVLKDANYKCHIDDGRLVVVDL